MGAHGPLTDTYVNRNPPIRLPCPARAGNHDDSALAAYFKCGRFREGPLPESYSYVRDFSEADVRWLGELPYSLSIPHLQALVVHAGVVPRVPLESQTAAHMSVSCPLPVVRCCCCCCLDLEQNNRRCPLIFFLVQDAHPLGAAQGRGGGRWL